MEINRVVKLIKPGDILLTQNPAGLGKMINWAQRVGQGDPSKYGHVAIIVRNPKTGQIDGTIAESVMRISYNNISDYNGNKICIMRHKKMNPYRYNLGMKEVKDNIGQIYPGHRLVVQLVDVLRSWAFRKVKMKPWFRYSKLMRLDWPVCSELAAQFLITAKLETGFPFEGWRGINPDHFDDARQSNDGLWETIFIGDLIKNKG